MLAAGADPNAAAFAGATPLIVAAQRGHDEITELLLAAGADPATRDAGRRTAGGLVDPAAGWICRPAAEPDVDHGHPRGRSLRADPAGQHAMVAAAWELGQFALLTEIARAIEPAELWEIGFATGPYDEESGRQWHRQFPVDTTLRITPEAPNADERRAQFEATVLAAIRAAGDKIVMVLTGPGHRHDVTVAVAQLVDEPSVLTTIVIEPATRETRDARSRRPEGFDAQVSFDPWHAARQLWPAVDALETTVAAYPSPRHEHLADSRSADRPAVSRPRPATRAARPVELPRSGARRAGASPAPLPRAAVRAVGAPDRPTRGIDAVRRTARNGRSAAELDSYRN